MAKLPSSGEFIWRSVHTNHTNDVAEITCLRTDTGFEFVFRINGKVITLSGFEAKIFYRLLKRANDE